MPKEKADHALYINDKKVMTDEQVAGVWKPLYDRFKIHIDFAHRTFRWDSEASLKAHVHCVIVGFSIAENKAERRLFDNGNEKIAKIINPFLIDAPIIFIENRSKPLCDVSEMCKGSIPVDDGNFFLTTEEKIDFLKVEPKAERFIKRFYGAREFLHNEERWCLWLLNASPSELKAMPKVMERVQNIKTFRLQSSKEATRKFADYPTRFMEIRQPTTSYIIFPSHSSENRKYIPIKNSILDDDDVYKGEDSDEDISSWDENAIWAHLKDKIYDSTITIVLISPNMKEPGKWQRSQWIPWEISYSLRETTRNDRTSHNNAILAVILPNKNGSYDYYNEDDLFPILKDNINNGYIYVVTWDDFRKYPTVDINIAFDHRDNTSSNDIKKSL